MPLAFIAPIALLLLTLSSCARPDWGDALQDKTAIGNGRQLLSAMVTADEKCPLCRDADVNLTLKSPLKDAAATGYLLLRRPSWIKFVSSNPFGQPILLITSDGARFQQLLMPQKTYLHGQVFSYLAHNNLPLALALGNWGSWLTGGVGQVKADEAEVRPDRENRGLWFAWRLPPLPEARGIRENDLWEHILVDAARRLVLARVISKGDGKTIARFDYGDRQADGSCPSAGTIMISGLEGGGAIKLVFSDPRTFAECPEDFFRLKKPENFQEFYMP